MPTELEMELLRMAAAERQRTQQPETDDELPELEPGMLLSASAQGEVRAAHQQAQRRLDYLFDLPSQGGPSREFIEETLGVMLSAETPEQVPVELHATVELSGPDADWVRDELRRGHNPGVSMGARVASAEPNANGDIFPAEALAGLFMSREARAQAELAGVSDLVAEGADIEFDSEMGHVGITPMASSGYRPSGGGGQGRVVSQRGEDGQWTSTVSRPQQAVGAPVSPRRTYPTPRPSEGVRGLSRGSEAPLDRSSIPSAIERVAGRGPFDD
jgi:hypothetical protein